MISLKAIRLIMTLSIALILVATSMSYMYKDLVETDFVPRHRTFENIDQECPVVYDAGSDDRPGPAFYSILSELNRDLLEENLYLLPDMRSLCQKSLVLRC